MSLVHSDAVGVSVPTEPVSGAAASAYTPGPWEAVRDGVLLVDDWVIRTSHPDPEMRDVMELWNASEADARLAASSPRLLDAAIAALPYLETAESDPAYKPGTVAAVTKQLRAAIQSATGEG